MKIKAILPLILLLVLHSSCTREDMSDCLTQGGLRINFSYEQGESVLPLKRADIYLFDVEGRFVCSHTDAAEPLSAAKRYTFDLPAGHYTAIVWGNLSNALTLTPTPFIEGQTTLDEVRLTLTRLTTVGLEADAIIVPDALDTDLYHSYATAISVADNQYTDVTMPLRRNTKDITINTRFVNADGSSCSLYNHNLRSAIRSNDGILSFENTLQACPDFYYKPHARTDITGGHDASFRKMRLFMDDPSEIILAYPDATDQNGVFFRKELMTLLRATGFADQQALDQTHSYTIELRFVCQDEHPTNTTVRIFVNGWEYVEISDEV